MALNARVGNTGVGVGKLPFTPPLLAAAAAAAAAGDGDAVEMGEGRARDMR